MIRKAKRGDVDNMIVQSSQLFYRNHIKDFVDSEHGLNSFAYLEGGVVKAVFGMETFWSGRGIVWALIGNVSNWVKFHKSVKKLLESLACKLDIIRLEMTTEVGFDESERWAEMLGFRCESLMTSFGMDGKDHKMWVRLWQQQYPL